MMALFLQLKNIIIKHTIILISSESPLNQKLRSINKDHWMNNSGFYVCKCLSALSLFNLFVFNIKYILQIDKNNQ